MIKRIEKNLLLFSLVSVLFFSIQLTVIASDFAVTGKCGENVYWNYNNETYELTISGSGDTYDYQFGESPFDKVNIKSVIIQEGVTSIGEYLFEHSIYLEKIIIADSVSKIGKGAFELCTELSEIILPDNLKYIEEDTFNYCTKLNSVYIPNGVIGILDRAFYYCPSLKSICIPNSVKRIESHAFNYCGSLIDIMISAGVEYIGLCAFESYSPRNVYYSGSKSEWETIIVDKYNGNINNGKVVYNAHIHQHSAYSVIESTCSNFGSKEYFCSCGDSFIKITPTKSHSTEMIISKAKLNLNGNLVEKCMRCEEIIKNEKIYSPTIIKLSTSECKYNGKVRTPSIVVKDSKGSKLKKDTDYKVSYPEGRKLPGKYVINVTFIGNYEGEKDLIFSILPKITTGVKAKTQTTYSITLTWSKTTGATGYRVYKYSPSKGKYVVKASVKDITTYKVSGLKAGTTYKFKIKPYVKNDDDTVIWGSASSVLTTATKPATPKLKLATASSGKATLNWADVSSESGYQIYYSTSKSGNYEKMKSVSTDTLKYTTSKLTAGKTYYFKVRAYIKVDGKVIYGDFSDVKSVIIKKATSSGSSNSSGSSSNSSSSSSSKPEIGGGTYYITNTGKKYHVSGCRTLRGSKIAVSYEYASRNYEPCGVCLN